MLFRSSPPLSFSLSEALSLSVCVFFSLSISVSFVCSLSPSTSLSLLKSHFLPSISFVSRYCCSGAWETTTLSPCPEDTVGSLRGRPAPVTVSLVEELPGSVPDLREEVVHQQPCTVHNTHLDQDQDRGQTNRPHIHPHPSPSTLTQMMLSREFTQS